MRDFLQALEGHIKRVCCMNEIRILSLGATCFSAASSRFCDASNASSSSAGLVLGCGVAFYVGGGLEDVPMADSPDASSYIIVARVLVGWDCVGEAGWPCSSGDCTTTLFLPIISAESTIEGSMADSSLPGVPPRRGHVFM